MVLQFCGQNTGKGCGVPLNEYTASLNGATRKGVLYKHLCKDCCRQRTQERKTLRTMHPVPPAGSPCQCCGLHKGKLELDHSAVTGEFRGYICRSCNLGIGCLGDCSDGVLNAYYYLKKQHDRVTEASEPVRVFGLPRHPSPMARGAEAEDSSD